MSRRYDVNIEWCGVCNMCMRETEDSPYMSLSDAKLICRSCFDIEKKNLAKKNPSLFIKNKLLSPGMEWEIPD